MKIEVSGLADAQRELNKAMKEINDESEEMLTVMLMAISANTAPYIPVDTSALINSELRSVTPVTSTEGSFLVGEISYGSDGSVNPSGTPVQEYAYYVHEGIQKNWQKPGASNQFLTKDVIDFMEADLASIVAEYSS